MKSIGEETYVNPDIDMYRDLGRFLMHDYDEYENKQLSVDNKITNRASTVTMFHWSFPKHTSKMLFTGDAYDLHCDITRTVMAFDANADLSFKVDVLKMSALEMAGQPSFFYKSR